MAEEALAITDDDEARYETFAKAEAVLLDHGFAIPIHTNDRVYTFGKLNVFEGPYAAFGFSTLRYKGLARDGDLHGHGGVRRGLPDLTDRARGSAGRRRCRISGQVFLSRINARLCRFASLTATARR